MLLASVCPHHTRQIAFWSLPAVELYKAHISAVEHASASDCKMSELLQQLDARLTQMTTEHQSNIQQLKLQHQQAIVHLHAGRY